MPIKMNAAQTKRSEATLAERIQQITTVDSLEAAMLAKARAEGALEGMGEMGYSTLATEAQQARINKAYAAARKCFKPAATVRAQTNGSWALQCLREMVLPASLIQAMGGVLTAMDRARGRAGVDRARLQVSPLLAELRSLGVIDDGEESITREVMDDAAERRCNELYKA